MDKRNVCKEKGIVRVLLDREVVNELIKRKQVGDTYSDIIRKLLEK